MHIVDIDRRIEIPADSPLPTCEWFLLCDHTAFGVSHVPFDPYWIPVCERCADKLDLTVVLF